MDYYNEKNIIINVIDKQNISHKKSVNNFNRYPKFGFRSYSRVTIKNIFWQNVPHKNARMNRVKERVYKSYNNTLRSKKINKNVSHSANKKLTNTKKNNVFTVGFFSKYSTHGGLNTLIDVCEEIYNESKNIKLLLIKTKKYHTKQNKPFIVYIKRINISTRSYYNKLDLYCISYRRNTPDTIITTSYICRELNNNVPLLISRNVPTNIT